MWNRLKRVLERLKSKSMWNRLKRAVVANMITIFTIFTVVMALSHLIWPKAAIDSIFIALIVLAAIPWLAPLLRTFELPGGFKFELLQQGTRDTSPPIQPPPILEPQPRGFSADARKILATLWKYQREYFGDKPTEKRWTFVVNPTAPVFSSYLSGLAELVRKGIAIVAPDNWHCMLTDVGLQYCRNHPNEVVETDVYHF